ncbi:uncharacterized protein LOC105164291 isoform X2 [Sesamum indicum]|uniref:Uncharacterized protein LOC105164291 isoform X2 n=1 Tax=Sesamum indicum TaxID=4182 RepID=A0A6I9TA42_SESIN|nr:uncharacterized protein LOC105164291 isoform X2 [Sesamum indicum]
MLISSDSGVNMVLGFDDSLQNVLTQTMLNQEEIFRNQICSSRSMKNPCLQEHRAIPRHQRRPLDLELSPSHYTHDDEGLTSESYGCVTQEVSGKMKYDVYDDKLSSMEELKLSLGADAEAWQKVGSRKSCKDKIICSPSRETTSLEGSTYFGDLVTRHGLGCPIQVTNSGAKHEFGGSSCSFSFRSRKTDVFYRISESPSVTDSRPILLERKHFNQGVEQCHDELPQKSMSARRKLFTSHEVGELDLNKALPDESSVHSIDHWTSNPSKCTSSGVTDDEVGRYGQPTHLTDLDWRKPKNNCSNESSALVMGRQDMANSTLTTLPSRCTGEHICGSILCSEGTGSVCRPPSDNKDTNVRLKKAESEISLADQACQKTFIPEMNSKKNKEEKLHSHYSCQELLEGTDSNRSPVSCKSDGTTDDISSNTRTRECGIGTSNSNVSASVFQNSESSLVTTKPVEHNVATSVEMKSQSYPKKEDVDIMVRKGAVSLLYFSSECSTRIKDHVLETQKTKGNHNVVKDVPQSSSESYEAIVLNQRECSAEEYCMSSTPFEVSSSNKKDHGVKLRRGRRMKDFQKDILPSMSSLSRQEICEDIKIMELAIRSREYKKYRSKTTNRNDCFSSARSKRSRLSYVGRRYYS